MNKKIFLFGPYPPPYGGVSIYVHALNEFLIEVGFDCNLKIYRQDGTAIDYVQPSFTSVYKNFFKITKKDTCLDSCSFFLEYPSIKATLAWLLIKMLKRFRWIKIIHDGSLPSRYKHFAFVQKFVFHAAIKFIDELIVVSEDLYSWLRNNIKVKQKVLLIKSLLPIPPQTFNTPLPVEIEQAIAHHRKTVCCIGAFTPAYGFKHVADAVEKIRKETEDDIGLVFINASFTGDKNYKSKVLKQREWITVLTDIPRSQVLQILKRSNVFVRGVDFESYGLSRVESLWCGTPVVATRVGETRGMLLYDYGNVKELVQQIKKALYTPSGQDIHKWAEHFRQEAEANLAAIINIINSGRGSNG